MSLFYSKWKALLMFSNMVYQDFKQDKCFDLASSLSYTTLLSLVPLFSLVFMGFASFSVFQDVLGELEQFIFSNLIPASSEVIREYMMHFVGKTTKLTILGISSLIIIALLLMWKIDQVFNQIWYCHSKRDKVKTLMTYWAILTLGPILIGMSLMATSYLTSLPIISDTAEVIGVKKYILHLVALTFTLLAFSLLYLVIPKRRVPIKDALIGGLVATIFFEFAKQGFAWYVSNNHTYQNIYGALSTIPIFLLWIYISWVIILIGAITARNISLFSSRVLMQQAKGSEQDNLENAFNILYLLWCDSLSGEVVSEHRLEQKMPQLDFFHLQQILQKLAAQKWIHRTDEQKWALSKNLDKIKLSELHLSLHYSLPNHSETKCLQSIVEKISIMATEHMDASVIQLFKQQLEVEKQT